MEPFVDQESREKERFRRKIFGIVCIVLFFLFVSGLIYLVGFSQFSKVTAITILGTDRISQDDVLRAFETAVQKNPFVRYLSAENFFLWPSGKVTIGYTMVETAVVKKNFITRSVEIVVKERERFGVWCSSDVSCFWFDAMGILFDEAPVIEGPFIVRVVDEERDSLSLGGRMMEPRFIGNFITIVRAMKNAGLPARSITFSQKLQELRWKTFEGGDVLLSVRFDPTINILALERFIQQYPLTNLHYVDLRVEGRLYYKPF